MKKDLAIQTAKNVDFTGLEPRTLYIAGGAIKKDLCEKYQKEPIEPRTPDLRVSEL